MKKRITWGGIFLVIVVVIIAYLVINNKTFSTKELLSDIDLNADGLSVKVQKFGSDGFEDIKLTAEEENIFINNLKTAKFKKVKGFSGSFSEYAISLKSNKYIAFYIDVEKSMIHLADENTYEIKNGEQIIELLSTKNP